MSATSLEDLAEGVGLGEVRARYPGTFIPDGVALERRLTLDRVVDDSLTRDLHDMLTRYGFRAVERALLRAISGFDIPGHPDSIPPPLVDEIDLALDASGREVRHV